MRLGRLRARLTVLRPTAGAKNALNETVESWPEFGKFWAEDFTQRAAEGTKAGQTMASVEKVWRLRWLARAKTITPQDRIVCDGITYSIIGVTEPFHREVIQIAAIATSEGSIAP